jgi:hypothetical protein
MIYVSDDYKNYVDKISDNMDFFIWVNLFCIFLLCLGVFTGMFYNWILGMISIAFATFYEFYLWVKLSSVKYKITLTDYGVRGQKIKLVSKFNNNSNFGEADEFYLVYSDIISYRILNNKTLQIRNKNRSNFDDLNYKFSNISEEKLKLLAETFEKFGIHRID